MRTHLTYQYHEGNLWRWAQMGVFKVRFEPILMDRLLASKLLNQYAESAAKGDYFAKFAAEFAEELTDAIREYDEFNQSFQPSNNPGSYGMGTEKNHDCHV